MDILDSDWLIHMLKKSSTKPQARLLSLFDILEDWLDAPSVRDYIAQKQVSGNLKHNHKLQDFLTLEAAKSGAAMPEMLAHQLYFMAVAASQEKLNHNCAEGALSLAHAKNAASALIAAQTSHKYYINKKSAYTLAASFLGALVVAGSLFIFNQTTPIAASQIAFKESNKVVAKVNLIASAQQTSALIAQIDQMRKGNCQLIEALQLPDSYKKVYFENIVLGQISTNIEDQKLVHQLLEMVRCNYTPMLMANSKN